VIYVNPPDSQLQRPGGALNASLLEADGQASPSQQTCQWAQWPFYPFRGINMQRQEAALRGTINRWDLSQEWPFYRYKSMDYHEHT
jgi:hypothetical protein